MDARANDLDANRERPRTGLFGHFCCTAPALEPALQQAHEAGVPVADDEQDEEWGREVVLVGEGVNDRREEVTAEEDLDPGSELETLAVLGCLGLFTLGGDAVLGRADEGALDAEKGLHDGLGVGDGETDSDSHEEREVEEGPLPGSGKELALAHHVKDGDGE